jgi:hypothetical protein
MVTAGRAGSPHLGDEVVSCRRPQPFVLQGLHDLVLEVHGRFPSRSVVFRLSRAGPQAAVLAAGRYVVDSVAAQVDGATPGSFLAVAARSGGRIVRAVGGAYTAALGNWAPRAA